MKKVSFILLTAACALGILLCSSAGKTCLYAQDSPQNSEEPSDNTGNPPPPQDNPQPDDETIDENDTSGIDPWFLENQKNPPQNQPQREE